MAGLKLKLTQSRETSESRPDAGERKKSTRRSSAASTASDAFVALGEETAPATSHGDDGSSNSLDHGRLVVKDIHEANEVIVQRLKGIKDAHAREQCSIFLALPSKKRFPDYYVVISRPMSFQCIQDKLNERTSDAGYASSAALLQDYHLIFENAKTYNEPGSTIYEDADALQKELSAIAKRLHVQSEARPTSIKISLSSPPPRLARATEASEPLPKLKINKRQEQQAKLMVSELETPSKRGRGRPPTKKFKEAQVDALESPRLILKTKFLSSPAPSASGSSPDVVSFEHGTAKQTKGTKEDLRHLFQAVRSDAAARAQVILATKRIDVQKAYHSDLDGVKSQWCLIHCAAFFGATHAIRLLIDTFGADIEATDPMYESTALAWAAFGNQFEASQLLVLRYGARVDVRNSLGSLPLDLVPETEAAKGGERAAEWRALFDLQHAGHTTLLSHRQSLILREVRRLTDPEDASRRLCELFAELPHRKEYPGYYQVIRSPICLNDIEAKVAGKSMQSYSVKELESDLRLLIRNARTFNESGSQVVRDANHISKALSRWLTMEDEETSAAPVDSNLLAPTIDLKAVTPKRKRAAAQDRDSLAEEEHELESRPDENGSSSPRPSPPSYRHSFLRRKEKRGRRKKHQSGPTNTPVESKPVIVTSTGTLDMKQVRAQFAVGSYTFPSGTIVRPGDFLTLHLAEGASTDPVTGRERPKIVQVLSFWNHPREKERGTGQPALYFTCNAYLYPDQTIHHPTRLFYPRELFKTKPKLDFPVALLDQHASVLPVELYFRTHRPYSHIPESNVWVCEYKYSEWGKSMHRIRDWWIANRLAPPSNHLHDLIAWSEPPIPLRTVPSIYAKEIDVAAAPKALNEKSKNVLMSLQTNEQGEMIVPSILKGRRTNKALKLLGSLPPASAERLAAAALTERQRQLALAKERERMASASATPPSMASSFMHGQSGRVPLSFHPHAQPPRLAPMPISMLTANIHDSGNGLQHLSFGPGPSAFSPAPPQAQALARPASSAHAKPSTHLPTTAGPGLSVPSASSAASASSVSAASSGPRVVPSDSGLPWSQAHGFTAVLIASFTAVEPSTAATPPDSPIASHSSTTSFAVRPIPRFNKLLALGGIRSQFVALPCLSSDSTVEHYRRLSLIFYSVAKEKGSEPEHWFFFNRQRIYPMPDASPSGPGPAHTNLVLELKPAGSAIHLFEVFQVRTQGEQGLSSFQTRAMASSGSMIDAKTRVSIALSLFFRS